MSIVKLVLFFTTSQPPHDRQIYYNAENRLCRQQSCFPCLDRVRKNSLIYRFRILSQRIAVPVACKANAYALNHISADIHQLCKNNIIFVCIISEKRHYKTVLDYRNIRFFYNQPIAFWRKLPMNIAQTVTVTVFTKLINFTVAYRLRLVSRNREITAVGDNFRFLLFWKNTNKATLFNTDRKENIPSIS